VDVVEDAVRAISSSSASSTASSTEMTAPRSTAWSYEPSPPRRRAAVESFKSPGASSGDGLCALDAHVEQLSRMCQLMRAIADDAA
jgi:hypothetical protein